MSDRDFLIRRMQQQVTVWEQSGDQRAVFLRCYSMMTANMLMAIEAGRFVDPVWVDTLLHRFADYYFDALEQYERCSPATPAVWRQAHQFSQERELHVLQHLFLGINAHINYDLALALYDGLCEEWPLLIGNERNRRSADHNMVNQVIAETIDAVQDQVIEPRSPAMALVDSLMGRMDEWLLSQLITSWRTDVWHAAVGLLDAGSPEQRELKRQELEQAVLKRCEGLVAL